LSNPKIERIVQIDIGQKRTNDSTHAIDNLVPLRTQMGRKPGSSA
jgi:hypothetical protein